MPSKGKALDLTSELQKILINIKYFKSSCFIIRIKSSAKHTAPCQRKEMCVPLFQRPLQKQKGKTEGSETVSLGGGRHTYVN